ncbi:hypothetical protein SAMN02745136_00095 [Anaerocolumna jejuensis DSM 15929]|uniref:Uncharacterized protein n=1 Tax=Anaerocolumna jejuensis DSM 15929 TaxID=1121322 RepID=A0A1M6JIM7_9FIRM|nr:hypothetical protein SAMN02745136_00095 [Anaerocolumna jejuensis DSM 15929]
MVEVWKAVNNIMSIEISYNSVTVTFWQMFIYFALLTFVVCFIRNLFD